MKFNKKEKIKVCTSCNKKDKSVKERTIKENGATGYYDVKVVWCDGCVEHHNHYLLASWGGYDF